MYQCSVGKLVHTTCEFGEQKIILSEIPIDLVKLLSNRLNAEKRARAPFTDLPLSTICVTHYDMYIAQYEDYQRSCFGCCCPFSDYVIHFAYTDLYTISYEEELMYKDRSRLLLAGRQLCSSCVKELRNEDDFIDEDFTDIFPGLSAKFDEAEFQKMYSAACESHDTSLPTVLKSLQAKTAHTLMKGKDVLSILATNYGKSLIQVLPSFLKFRVLGLTSVTLIISPLSALMQDYHQKILDWGLNCIILNDGTLKNKIVQEVIGTKRRMALFLISSPEILVTKEARRLFGSVKIDFIMVDECHTSVTWGDEFRQDFARIHEIRQATSAPIGLFTATLTTDMVKTLVTNTGLMDDNYEQVSDSPDRPEIYLELRRKTKLKENLAFLRDDFIQNGMNMTRTLFFIHSVNKTHEFNFEFRDMLPDYGKVGEEGYISEHFSSCTEPEARKRILKDFCDPNGLIRVLFTTVSYGMGIDNKTVSQVVVNEIRKDSNELWQKIGRACRDGNLGNAILLTRGKTTGDIIIKDTCIRHCILKNLMGYAGPAPRDSCSCNNLQGCTCEKCLCCSVCRRKCSCRTAYSPDCLKEHESWRNVEQDSDDESDGEQDQFNIGLDASKVLESDEEGWYTD